MHKASIKLINKWSQELKKYVTRTDHRLACYFEEKTYDKTLAVR